MFAKNYKYYTILEQALISGKNSSLEANFSLDIMLKLFGTSVSKSYKRKTKTIRSLVVATIEVLTVFC